MFKNFLTSKLFISTIIFSASVNCFYHNNTKSNKESCHFKPYLKKIIFLDGLPACGKSTLSKKIKEKLQLLEYNVHLIESDVIAESLAEGNDNIPWGRGVTESIELALKHVNNENNIVILDSFMWPELQKKLNNENFFFVLLYAPLELIIQRFWQRYCLNHADCIEEKDFLPVLKITNLTQSFFNKYFFSKESSQSLVTRFNENEALYTNLKFDLVLNSALHTIDALSDMAIASYLASKT